MRSRLSLLLLSLLTLVEPSATEAALVPNLDLDSLCNHADLIVVGVVANVRREGEATVNGQAQSMEVPSMSAELNVQRVLKGKVASTKLSFTFLLHPPPAGVIVRGQFGIFFFREAKSGIEILDRYHPYVVAAPGAPMTVGTYLDQVTAELAYATALAGTPPQAKREAVEALRTLPTPAATLALRTAAQDGDTNTRISALAALLARGNIDYLDQAVSALLSGDQGIDEFLVWRLTSSLEFGVKDPRAIPALGRLLHARRVPARRAATAALRNTQHGNAIKPLSEALYDNDSEVQYQAVIGLAEITSTTGEWAPASDTFLKDPQHYLDHWRDWAKSRN
jgi:hypothetical protein